MQLLGASDGRVVGQYRILAELGRGGMGQVLLGSGPDGRLVALKQVNEQLTADNGFRVRFRHEVAASRMVSGAYTAAVVDADPDAATPWLASVFVPGPSLLEAVSAAGPLPEDAMLRLAAGLACALAEVHRVGLVHRDLKPSNVLLAADGPRVIDFGIARAVDSDESSELTRTGWLVGSPGFMSPEQAEGRELTSASDMFSLGAVLVMAATGHGPFSGPSAVRILYQIVHAEPKLAGIPQRLRPIIERCLAKNPTDRPTPVQLLESIGKLAPSTRPWPAAVHDLITRQCAEVARLLDVTSEQPAKLPTFGEADRRVAEPAGDQSTTQELYPPPPYPQAPYQRSRQRHASGLADAAMILCTVSSLFLAVSGGGFILFGLPTVVNDIPSWAVVLTDVMWGIGDILVLVGTILMWCKKSAGRMLAIIGLSMVVASTLGLELVSLSASLDVIMSPLQYLINVFTVLSLALVLLPSTGRYLKAQRRARYKSPSHPNPDTPLLT
ncbi:serine/threonine-protein kinase [Actinocrispum wychmicini]|uniref:Serine/threonine protein kinase n=1 Tax=Actinocrispum wychmicini TaxID=1213861 RepID=A0A4R2IHP2_9PSEU|nr:serine/threonine-protein kinase [Actinocrispum wychmicini]TCO43792.1 serine/threonine protein kinase [Actinocrispum wychmicini]